MKVTKQQKVLGGVLVLGMVALAMDRFVFSTATPDPSTSDASVLSRDSRTNVWTRGSGEPPAPDA